MQRKTGKTPLAKGELPVLSFVGELRRLLLMPIYNQPV